MADRPDGRFSCCRPTFPVPQRATACYMVHADSQVAPGKAIRMPGLCTICADLTRVKQLLHAAAAGWKQIMGEPQVERWP